MSTRDEPLVTPIASPWLDDDGKPRPPTQPELVQQLLDLARENFEGSQKEWAEFKTNFKNELGVGKYEIQQAGREASGDLDAIAQALFEARHGLFSNPIEAAGYSGDYESRAAGAQGDEWSLGKSRDALSMLEGRAQEGLTPVERLQMEMARRDQESQQRASRDAALRDMRARGFGGGGMEMAALLGTQQETANRRALENMAQMGLAQQRSDRALELMGGLGLDIDKQVFGQEFDRGTAADKATEFNKNLRFDYDKYKTDTEFKEREDQWTGIKDVSEVGRETIKDKYDYRIAAPVWGAEMTGRYLNPKPPDNTDQQHATRDILGWRQSEDVANKLRKSGSGGFLEDVGDFFFG